MSGRCRRRRAAAWLPSLLLLLSLLAASGLTKIARAQAGDEAEDVLEDEDEYHDEDEDEDRAYLLVRKNVKEQLLKEGSNMTVVISVFNAGKGIAMDVTLKDAEPPENTELVIGTLSGSFKSISPGRSEDHEYVLIPKGGGIVRFEPATVQYYPRPGATERQTVWSTMTGGRIMTTTEHFTRYILIAGQYATFGLIKTVRQWLQLAIVAAILGFLVGANWLFKTVSAARVSQSRRRAQKALGVEEIVKND